MILSHFSYRINNYGQNTPEGSDLMRQLILILIIIGGLNWGLVGLFQFNLVSAIFSGNLYFLARIIYALVGIAAVWSISFLFEDRREG